MIDTIYDERYSTTRRLSTEKPGCFDASVDGITALLKTASSDQTIAEGGLRLQGLYKASSECEPLITVVTVVYNGYEFLEGTIKSVIEQTYDNVEYIIVDGGSTDGTLDIIRKYEHAIDYWVSEPDKGIYDAMNNGVRLSTGKWINFMNSDDFLSSDIVLSSIAGISITSNNDCPIIYGLLRMIDASKNELSVIGNRWDVAKKYLGYRLTIPHQSMFVRLKNMKEEGGFKLKYKISADYELTLRLLKNKSALFLGDLMIADMRVGGVSSNPVNSLKLLKESKEAQLENNYKRKKLLFSLAVMRVYVRKIIWAIFGESIGRNVLDIGNMCRFKKSYWSKTGK